MLAIHELTHAFAVSAQLGTAFLNEVSRVTMLSKGYRERLASLETLHADCSVVSLLSNVQVFQDRCQQLIVYARYQEAEAYLGLLSALASHTLVDHTAFALERRAESVAWVKELLARRIEQPGVVRGLVRYLAQVLQNGDLWLLMAKDVQLVSGFIDGRALQYNEPSMAAINGDTVNAVCTQLCHALQCYMDDGELLLGQLKALSKAEEVEGQRERWELLRSSAEDFADQCFFRLEAVCSVLAHLSEAALEGTAVEWTVRALSRVFKLLTAVTKQAFTAAKKPRSPFTQLIHYAVRALSPATTAFVLYVTGADKGEEAAQKNDTMVRPSRTRGSACNLRSCRTHSFVCVRVLL